MAVKSEAGFKECKLTSKKKKTQETRGGMRSHYQDEWRQGKGAGGHDFAIEKKKMPKAK